MTSIRYPAAALIVASIVLAAACSTGAPPATTLPPEAPVAALRPTTTLPEPVRTTTTAAPAPTTTAPPHHMPGLHVDHSLIPADEAGHASPRFRAAPLEKLVGDGTAAFRVNCSFSHMRFDDPIVFPGRPGAAHLHIFFGNTAVDGNSTPESVRAAGDSTCTGGTANRSSYWAPAVVDTSTGAPVTSPDKPFALMVYYKTGYDGVRHETVQNFPEGLRMIAGSATSTKPQPGVVTYSCTGEAHGPEILDHTSIPDCLPRQLFVMSIKFPQCWDGINLDSPDHKSHMAYGLGWPNRGCPDSHPVPLPQITQNYRYRVPTTGMSNWRLSSDMDEGPAGYSGHADWMNGWDPAVFQRVVDNCYRGGFDCRMNLLGDGEELY